MNRVLVSFVLFFVIIIALTACQRSPEGGDVVPDTPQFVLPPLRLEAGGLRIAFHYETGKVRFLGAAEGKTISQPAGLSANPTPEQAGRNFLAGYGSFFGLESQASELIFKKDRSLDNGRSMVRFQQVFQSIPVFAGDLIVNMDANNNVLSVTAEILPDLERFRTLLAEFDDPADLPVTLSDAEAIALASTARKYALEASDLSVAAGTGELQIFNHALLGDPGIRLSALVWRVTISSEGNAIDELVLVDAERGVVSLSFNQIADALDRKTYDFLGQVDIAAAALACDEAITCTYENGFDRHIVTAHKFAGSTYDFYFQEHDRDSIDGQGMPMVSYIHYGGGGASWSDGVFLHGGTKPYHAVPIPEDVVGHEFTHGVTQEESNLYYYYQSGAINESFSDVWGEFIDQTHSDGETFTVQVGNNPPQDDPDDTDTPDVRWFFAEDLISTFGGNAGPLRNLKDPTAAGLDPDKMSSEYYACSEYDKGGVHKNSGVNNKLAYLMTDGDTFNGYTIAGLGYEKVADLYYEVQINLLISGSDYPDLCEALKQAAINLDYSIADTQQIDNALAGVEMCQQPVQCETPSAPVCPAGTLPDNLFFADLEVTAGNWTSDSITGINRWTIKGDFYANSGQGHIHSPDQDIISDTFVSMVKDVTLSSPGAYMHFYHAYGFDNLDGQNFDGGILEYSTNGGSTWTDAGSLMTHNGYTGTISATANPLNGREAFVGDSRGYTSTRLYLGSLQGEEVRFRFRMGTDDGGGDYGWFIDDVRIHSCVFSPDACSSIQTVQSKASGDWNVAATWNPAGVPGKYDVVKINPVHTVTAPPSTIEITSLCNNGALDGSPGAQLRVEATDFIVNAGSVISADGKQASGSSPAVYVSATSANDVFLVAGQDIENTETGVIMGGIGGRDNTVSWFTGQSIHAKGASGGDVILLGSNITNKGDIGPMSNSLSGIPSTEGGFGGEANNYGSEGLENSGDATGGKGGGIVIQAENIFFNHPGGRICSGNGGQATVGGSFGQFTATGGSSGGSIFIFAPVTIQNGEICNGTGGSAMWDPSMIMTDSNATIHGAKDITIFGGDDWSLDLSGMGSGALSATDTITIAVGKGGVVDLRGNNNKIFDTNRLEIFSDFILLDYGQTLDSMANTTLIETGPAKILYAVAISAAPQLEAERGSISVDFSVINGGPAEDIYKLSITDSQGWSIDAPRFVLVNSLSTETRDFTLDIPADRVGNNLITITASSLSDPETEAIAELVVTSRDRQRQEE